MKQRIILISGLAASGKTTIGEILQERLQSSARVESDFLILVKPFERGEALSRLKIENSAVLIKNFIAHGFQNIIVVGAVWNQRELEMLINQLSNLQYDMDLFWLDVSKEIRLARAAKRQDPGDTAEDFEKTESILQPKLPLKVLGGNFYLLDGTKPSTELVEEILNYIQE